MIDHVLTSRAHILRRQSRARDGEARTKSNDQKCNGKADGDSRYCRSAQPSDPKRIGQLVSGLQHVAENDGNR